MGRLYSADCTGTRGQPYAEIEPTAAFHTWGTRSGKDRRMGGFILRVMF